MMVGTKGNGSLGFRRGGLEAPALRGSRFRSQGLGVGGSVAGAWAHE